MTHQAYKRSSKTTGGAGCHAPWLIKNLGVYSTYVRYKEGQRGGRVIMGEGDIIPKGLFSQGIR